MKRVICGLLVSVLTVPLGLGCRNESSPSPKNDTSESTPAGKPDTEPTPATRPVAEQGSQQPPPPNEPPPATQPQARAPSTAPAPAASGHPRVELRIRQGSEDWGWIVLELDEEKAPITVQNFLRYVDEGYFNGTIFHRVLSDFMIQGGGFSAINAPKQEGLHDPIENECMNGLSNLTGTISMARTGEPHSATSQFFINVADNNGTVKYMLDPRPDGGWGYAVFGKVVEGMDVVNRIRDVETRPDPRDRRQPPEKSVPVNPPMIVTAQRAR